MNSNYTRRDFLKTVVVSAGALGASNLIGCGGTGTEQHAEAGIPPELFHFSVVDTGSVFPQSVASGDPKASSIILWTRINPGTSPGDRTVAMQVSSDSNFNTILMQTTLTATPEADYSLKVKITDLSDAKTYYYRFIFDETSSKTGRFKTAPASTTDNTVKFGFISCQDYVNGYYNALTKFLEDDHIDTVDFIVHLGDYIYETTGDPSFQANVRPIIFTDQAGAIPLPDSTSPTHYAASSLSNYRQLYQTYRSDEILQQLHEKFAFINIWDDHEFSDDSWQDVGTYKDEKEDEQNTIRKENAEQAFFEFTPIDIVPDTGIAESEGQVVVDSADLYPSIISRQFRFGGNLNLMMTDFRTFRPDHVIPEDSYPGQVIIPELEIGYTLIASFFAGALTACSADPATDPADDFIYDKVAAVAGPAAVNPDFDASNPFALIDPVDIQAMVHDELGIALTGSLLLQYVDLDEAAFANHKAAMQAVVAQQYLAAGVPAADVTAKAAEKITGRMAIDFINATITAYNASFDPDLPLLSDATYEYGMTYAQLGRSATSVIAESGIGARYNVVKNTYDIYTLYLSSVAPSLHPTSADPDYVNPDYDNAWGTAQQTSILINLSFGNATWNVLGSSTSFASMVLDASTGTCGGADSLLRQTLNGASLGAAMPDAQIYLNVDQWDGFPVRRTILMDDPTSAIANAGLKTLKGSNTVIISGDIHAAFVTDHGANTDGNRAVEFTTPAVSSGNFASFVTGAVATIIDSTTDNDGVDSTDISLAADLVGTGVTIDGFLREGNSGIAYTNNSVNGVSIIEITSTSLTNTFHQLSTGVYPGGVAAGFEPAGGFVTNLVTSHYADPTALTWTTTTYRVTKTSGANGAPTLVTT